MSILYGLQNTENHFFDSPELRLTVWKHIKENAKAKGIFIDTINGYHDHCLINLGIGQTMSKTMQLLKGESSYWINKRNLCKQRFEWQEEYYAVSVSQSIVDRVRAYIKNQEEHHKRQELQRELDHFVERYGFEKLKG